MYFWIFANPTEEEVPVKPFIKHIFFSVSARRIIMPGKANIIEALILNQSRINLLLTPFLLVFSCHSSLPFYACADALFINIAQAFGLLNKVYIQSEISECPASSRQNVRSAPLLVQMCCKRNASAYVVSLYLIPPMPITKYRRLNLCLGYFISSS